jgi:hypothetical protein
MPQGAKGAFPERGLSRAKLDRTRSFRCAHRTSRVIPIIQEPRWLNRAFPRVIPTRSRQRGRVTARSQGGAAVPGITRVRPHVAHAPTVPTTR